MSKQNEGNQKGSVTGPSYVSWVDMARGGAITLVVLGHTWRGLYSAELIPPGFYRVVDNGIYAFHMPLFFIISGFFYFSHLPKLDLLHRGLAVTRRLLIPLVIWTYIFLFLRVLFSDFTNAKPDFNSLLVLPFPGILHFWFLWALWLIQIGLLLVAALLPRGRRGDFLLVISAVLVTALWANGPILPFQSILGDVYRYGIYFVFGAFAFRLLAPAVVKRRGLIFASVIFLMLLGITLVPDISRFWATILAIGLSVSFLFGIKGLSVYRLPGLRALQWIGAYSFSIYMMHTIFSVSARALLLAGGVTLLPLHLFVGIFAGILCPIFASLLLARVGGGRFLGLQDRPPPSAS